ncbi:MAG: aryl-sulfate sulfotransferase [Bacteroidota bacterium]
MVKKLSLILVLVFVFTKINAQQQETYTFAVGGTYAYLFDTAATTSSQYYARWAVSSTSYSAHFLKDTIYQSTGSGSGGGSWGSIKKWVCSSPTVATNTWTYTVTGGHHDICPLPNGNVLIIVHDSKTAANVSAVGGTYSGTVQSEKIQEIRQTGPTTGQVVWEWKLWDHLCQSTNPAITTTYVTSVAANPQLMNVNYNMTSDWIHMNGIDYNAQLDQIVVSSHFMNEIWVIDHSTTTTQAATHSGGNGGRGGDFLYRWGNPAAYGCTAGGNGITLNTIHDARWVSSTNAKYPNYISMYHNNGGGTVQAVLCQAPHNGYNYTYTAGSVIAPTTCTKPTIPSITGVADQGSIQVVENGNILITKPNNTFYECNGTGTTYQTLAVGSNHVDRLRKCKVYGPYTTASSSTSTICANNQITLSSTAVSPLQSSPTFTYSWSSVPAGFTSSSQNPTVTPNTAGNYTYTVTVTTAGCTSTSSVNVTVNACTDVEEAEANQSELVLLPNPSTGMVQLNEEFITNNTYDIIVCNSIGKVVFEGKNVKNIDLSEQGDGIFYVSVKTDSNAVINKKVILIK